MSPQLLDFASNSIACHQNSLMHMLHGARQMISMKSQLNKLVMRKMLHFRCLKSCCDKFALCLSIKTSIRYYNNDECKRTISIHLFHLYLFVIWYKHPNFLLLWILQYDSDYLARKPNVINPSFTLLQNRYKCIACCITCLSLSEYNYKFFYMHIKYDLCHLLSRTSTLRLPVMDFYQMYFIS